jgi:hypothetical protein
MTESELKAMHVEIGGRLIDYLSAYVKELCIAHNLNPLFATNIVSSSMVGMGLSSMIALGHKQDDLETLVKNMIRDIHKGGTIQGLF